MGSKPRSREDYVSRLVLEKQRAIYWLCSLLERDSTATRAGARRALAELGYDDGRIQSLLLLGEPGPRAGEGQPADTGSDDGGERQPASGRWSGRSRGAGTRLHGTLLEHGPGNG
jgi:hypothetical protein